MKYLVIDASLNGTGIRDKYTGEYLSPESFGLSSDTINQLNEWLLVYENEHYNEFKDDSIIDKLDQRGKEIALMIKNQLLEAKLEYFSNAQMISEII